MSKGQHDPTAREMAGLSRLDDKNIPQNLSRITKIGIVILLGLFIFIVWLFFSYGLGGNLTAQANNHLNKGIQIYESDQRRAFMDPRYIGVYIVDSASIQALEALQPGGIFKDCHNQTCTDSWVPITTLRQFTMGVGVIPLLDRYTMDLGDIIRTSSTKCVVRGSDPHDPGGVERLCINPHKHLIIYQWETA